MARARLAVCCTPLRLGEGPILVLISIARGAGRRLTLLSASHVVRVSD